MRERGRVEVEFQTVGFGPIYPSLEMLDADLVAINLFIVELTINLVKIDTVAASEHRADLEQVGAHLVDIAGFTGIIACGLNTSRQAVGRFKSGYVVGLPAMKRELYFL